AVLISFAAALLALEGLLERWLPPLAAAIVVSMAIAWLTWPIWLSAWIHQGLSPAAIQRLVDLHPGLVLNGILTATPPWTEQAIAYHLTALNQDIPIDLPHSPGPA